MRLTLLGTGHATVTELYNTCFTISVDSGNNAGNAVINADANAAKNSERNPERNSERNPERNSGQNPGSNIEGRREHFLVDAGGGNGILKILKEMNISLGSIHHLFVTHEHIDHVLGVIWIIRMIGQKWINTGNYEGNFHIYCHAQLAEKIKTIVRMTIDEKVSALIGKRIIFHAVEDGEKQNILGCPVTFFDIASVKAKQFGFSMILNDGQKLTCLGDEPYNEIDAPYVRGSDWLLSEAFCLYSEADIFKPYEKNHSTVRDACLLAEKMNIPNLVLYHTEDTHLPHKKELYTAEGREFYHGNLYVPDDLEIIEL